MSDKTAKQLARQYVATSFEYGVVEGKAVAPIYPGGQLQPTSMVCSACGKAHRPTCAQGKPNDQQECPRSRLLQELEPKE